MDSGKLIFLLLTYIAEMIDAQLLSEASLKMANSSCKMICQSIPDYKYGSYSDACLGCVCSNGGNNKRKLLSPCIPIIKEFMTNSRECTVACREKKSKLDTLKNLDIKYGVYHEVKTKYSSSKPIQHCYCYDKHEFIDDNIQDRRTICKDKVLNSKIEQDCINHCNTYDNPDLIAYNYMMYWGMCYCFSKKAGVQINYEEHKITADIAVCENNFMNINSSNCNDFCRNEKNQFTFGTYDPTCGSCRCNQYANPPSGNQNPLQPYNYRCLSTIEIDVTKRANGQRKVPDLRKGRTR